MAIQRKGDYDAIGASVVGLCDCMEALLARSVPNLHVHALALYLDLPLLKIYSERIDEGLVELISDVAAHQRSLAHSRVSDHQQFYLFLLFLVALSHAAQFFL